MKRLYAFTFFFLFAFIIQAQENLFYYKYKQKKYLQEVSDFGGCHGRTVTENYLRLYKSIPPSSVSISKTE